MKNCAWSLAEVMELICKKSLHKGTGQWNQWELFNFMSLTFVWHCNYSMTLLTTSSWHEALANFNKFQFPLGLGQFSSHLPGLKTQSQTWSTKKLWKLKLIFLPLVQIHPQTLLMNFTDAMTFMKMENLYLFWKLKRNKPIVHSRPSTFFPT